MGKGIGSRLSFGIAKETSRGTAESTADYWLAVNELNLEERDTKINKDQSFGVIEDSIGAAIVKQWSELTVTAPIGDQSFPLVLNAALGSLSSAANADASGSVYDHTVTVGQSAQHQALSLYIDDPLAAQDYKHALGSVDSLEIAYEQGAFLNYTLNCRAKKGETATLTPSLTAENLFLPQHLTFKLASAQSGLDGASATVIKRATISISKNLEDDDVLGDTAPADFLNKRLTIEGEIEALWDSESTFKTAALAATKQALRFDLDNTDVTIGTAENPRVMIDLNHCTFTEITRPVRVGDLVMQTISFKAHYDTTDSSMISVTNTNLVTSY